MKDETLSNVLIQANINTGNQLMFPLILVGKIFQTLEELQEHTLYFMKVYQLTISHMLQDQLINKLKKASKMKNALQECI